MSFYFTKITLRDWLVYEGETVISFGPSQDSRNIWVIYGLNGYGKTSLLRAIQWLFHGQMPDRYIKSCFNRNALRDGRNELSVSAEFIYNGRHYHLIRRAEARFKGGRMSHPKETVSLSIDYEPQKDAIADTISQILPKECQQFFFFDGLEIEKYAKDTHTKETREAIETVLGIPEVRNLEVDLGRLSKELEQERDQLLREQSLHEDLQIEKNEALLEVEATKDTVTNLMRKRESLQQQIVGLEERANELDRAQDEVIYLKELKRRKEELKERLSNYDKELRSYVTVAAKRLVLPLLKEQTVKLTNQVNKAERTTAQVSSARAQLELITNLLSEVNCICGRELDGESRQFLEKRSRELEDLANNSQRLQERTGSYTSNLTELKNLENRIHQIENLDSPENIQRALLTKYRLQVQLEEVEQEIAVRENKLKGDEDADVAQVFTTLGEKKQELKELTKQIKQAEDEVVLTEAALAKCQRALNEALKSIGDKKGVVDALQRTLAAQAVAKEMVERMLHLRRETIEQQMTNVFRMVTNKKKEYDRIELAEDFAPCIVTQSSQMMRSDELSAGEKEILAFSFIAGLNQSTETNAPLVMDTPFGHLDVHHRNGLLDALPKLPCQVILLATDRDLPENDLPNLSYCLGGRFDIVRDEVEEKSYIQAYR